MKNLFQGLVVASCLASSMAIAQDFNKGALAYDKGDYTTAMNEWRPLAEQGDVRGQGMLGVMYQSGKGVPQDDEEAAKWFRLAVKQGDAVAQSRLGVMYDTGKGVPRDIAEAAKLYRLAAEQGIAVAQSNLGAMYQYGDGVIQDNQSAHMWYNLASENGYEEGGKWRDKLEAKMTPVSIEEARLRARICIASNYLDCD